MDASLTMRIISRLNEIEAVARSLSEVKKRSELVAKEQRLKELVLAASQLVFIGREENKALEEQVVELKKKLEDIRASGIP